MAFELNRVKISGAPRHGAAKNKSVRAAAAPPQSVCTSCTAAVPETGKFLYNYVPRSFRMQKKNPRTFRGDRVKDETVFRRTF